MSKRILVISTSLEGEEQLPSPGGRLCRRRAGGGSPVGADLPAGKIHRLLHGCLACQSAGQCVIQDDAVEIAEKMGVAEVIAFATPFITTR